MEQATAAAAATSISALAPSHTPPRRPKYMSGCSLPFRRLMCDQTNRVFFTEFLQSQYCAENMFFWLACADLEKIKNGREFVAECNDMADVYISTEAPCQVNLSNELRENILQQLQHKQMPPRDLFEEARMHVYTIMEKDCFQRFMKSPEFREMLKYEDD